jgi:histidyl-tRNA synthetase
MIPRVKGTQDFLDLALFHFVRDQIITHFQRYNYIQIETPILEYTKLFKRSLGIDTDVVNKEMFIVKTHDNDEEKSICLRPENTASIVRAFLENHVQQIPWKVFTYGPMFRYERPQKGRYRQFNQCSIEVIGTSSVLQDVELIVALDRLFHERFLLNTYVVHINFIGCGQDRTFYTQALKKFLDMHASQMCSLCVERKEHNVLRVLDCKNETCQELYQKAPAITEHLCTVCAQEWQQVQEQLELLAVSYAHKVNLVRGLDYYHKTVFEFVSTSLGAQNAFCGGGRYDQLVSQLGGKQDYGCVGAAIGIERLMLLLESQKDSLALPPLRALHIIAPLSSQQLTLALLLADEIRTAGLTAEALLEGGSAKSMMRQANQKGAAFVLLLGDEEQERKEVTVKNMQTGAQESIAQVHLVAYLKKGLPSS